MTEDGAQSENPFQRQKRRAKKRFLMVAGAIVAAIALAVVLLWFFDGERVMVAHEREIDDLRGKYCRVLEAEKARTAATSHEPRDVPEAIVKVGWYSPHYDSISRDHPGGNADTVDLGELSWICAGDPDADKPREQVFYSVLMQLHDRERRDHYQYKGAKRLVEGIPRIQFVVLLELKEFQASQSRGSGTMDTGAYAGTVSLYRLSDAAYLGSVDVDQDAPGFATVFVGQNASKGEIDSMLDANTKIAMEKTIERKFEQHGVTVKLNP